MTYIIARKLCYNFRVNYLLFYIGGQMAVDFFIATLPSLNSFDFDRINFY